MLYILGLLMRYGDMHGYQIKQVIDRQISDFANIKLANLYYHLNKMVKEGLIAGKTAQEGARPKKKVYQITDKGKKEFAECLVKAQFEFLQFEFLFDGVLYFREHINEKEISAVIDKKIDILENLIHELKNHQKHTLESSSPQSNLYITSIFSHHLLHYQAELTWYQELKTKLINLNN